MKLVLVRHGETEGNLNQVVQGQTEGNLTPLGIQQARKAGHRLKTMNFDAAFVSDLKRTRDTAEHLTTHHPDALIVYEKRLREQHCGIYEGTPYGTIRQAATARGSTRYDFTPEGGESLHDVRQRVTQFVQELHATHANKTCLLISHGGPITQLLLHYLQEPNEKHNDYHPDNTAITILDLSNDQPRLELLNCTKHLE